MDSGENAITGLPVLTPPNTTWVGICDGSGKGEIMGFPTQMGSVSRRMRFYSRWG